MNLSSKEVSNNISILEKVMKAHGAECLYVPSFDQYISEYVPLWNNLRYYITGFKGSTADSMIINEKAHLFVDGRYHLQADQEVSSDDVEIHKCGLQDRIFLKALDLALENNSTKIGIIPERTPIHHYEQISQKFDEVIHINENKFLEDINFQIKTDFNEVFQVDENLIGQTVKERLERCPVTSDEGLFLSAIDDVAWITNLRGYHLSFLSSFLSKSIVSAKGIFLASNEHISFGRRDDLIKIYQYKNDISEVLPEMIKDSGVSQITYDVSFCTINDLEILKNSNVKVVKGSGLTNIKNIKFSVEIPEYERIFNLGDQAIFNTIVWCKEKVKNKQKVSELDLYNQTTHFYQAEGSVGQSFNTISGAGESGAIIHYGDPKSDRFINNEDLVLLDSGGYFESGLATDTTRTFLADSSNTNYSNFSKYKDAYTLVVKAQIQAESAVFKPGTKGREIAALARQPLYQKGHDFAHGLGHGVGVHVHEPGVRLSSVSDLPVHEGMLVSIEPGLYFNHEFGIRHENIVIVQKHPEFQGFLRFRTLVFIGLEEALLDLEQFSNQERKYYSWYKDQCAKRNRIFS